MKYLEDDKLAQLTLELTDAVLGHSREIHGRIEAFTMKRAGSDKKYAHALGERYVAEISALENEMASYQQFLQKLPHESKRKRSQSVGTQVEVETPSTKRTRAYSFDVSPDATQPSTALRKRSQSITDLGDFSELGTRRLMTDLILTLNACFPDYDFGNVKPVHFVRCGVNDAVHRINERLSELAAQKRPDFLRTLWESIDSVISLQDSEVFTFVPPSSQEDPLSFLTQTLLTDDSTACTRLWNFHYLIVNKSLKRILVFMCVEIMRPPDGDETPDVKEETYVYNVTDASEVASIDLDPAADVAGGIPIHTI